jgi:group I intron endonuclease
MTYVRPKPRTKFPGVYGVVHVASGQMYIGGSTDMTGRFTHHRFMLRRGKHKCKALQDLWTRHGEESFEFRVLERCKKDDVRSVEQRWHDNHPESLNTIKGVFRTGPSGPSGPGSEAAKRRWARPEYRAKRQAWLDRRDEGRFVKAVR